VKESHLLALAILAALAWATSSAFEYYVTTLNSDCGYTPAEACTHIARSQQNMIIWRGLAVLFAMITVLLLARKRSCSKKF
jgi:hypothetical protein